MFVKRDDRNIPVAIRAEAIARGWELTGETAIGTDGVIYYAASNGKVIGLDQKEGRFREILGKR